MFGRRRRRRSRGAAVARPVGALDAPFDSVEPPPVSPVRESRNGAPPHEGRDVRFQRLVAADEPGQAATTGFEIPESVVPTGIAPTPNFAVPAPPVAVTADDENTRTQPQAAFEEQPPVDAPRESVAASDVEALFQQVLSRLGDEARGNIEESVEAGTVSIREQAEAGAASIREQAEAAAFTLDQTSTQLGRTAADHLAQLLQASAESDAALASHRARAAKVTTDLERANADHLASAQATIERATTEATHEITAAAAAAKAELAQAETEMRMRLEEVAGRAKLLRRVTVGLLVFVGGVAIAGLILAANANGDSARPHLGPSVSSSTSTTSTTLPATTLPPTTVAPVTNQPSVAPPSRLPSATVSPPATSPPATTPPNPLCQILGNC